MAIVLGGSCPGGSCPGWRISLVAVVLGGSCPGGSCKDGCNPTDPAAIVSWFVINRSIMKMLCYERVIYLFI